MIIKIQNYNKQLLSSLILLFVFFINLSIEYSKYLDFIDEEVYEVKVEVVNIYEKPANNILNLKGKNFDFFTNIDKSEDVKKFDVLNIAIITLNISFYEYLKGFYTKTIYFDKLEKTLRFIDKIIEKINSNHQDEMIKELFQALFLGTSISKELRDICTNYGIAHVIALSGFHLAVLSFTIYWILYFPYSFIHQKYFPYRNKKYDLILISIVFLFYYLILTDIIPSLLRSFCYACCRYIFFAFKYKNCFIYEFIFYFYDCNCTFPTIFIFIGILIFHNCSFLYIFVYSIF